MTCVIIHKDNEKEIFLWLSETKMPYWESRIIDPSKILLTFYNAEDKLSFLMKFDDKIEEYYWFRSGV